VIITWDNAKRLANLNKHGLDFADLSLDFFLDSLVAPAKNGRFKAIGRHDGEVLIVVVFTPLGSEAIAMVSMRRASRKERSQFDAR
jgi:uncharacterized DUF497 family protein